MDEDEMEEDQHPLWMLVFLLSATIAIFAIPAIFAVSAFASNEGASLRIN